jgi:hypothetical protein
MCAIDLDKLEKRKEFMEPVDVVKKMGSALSCVQALTPRVSHTPLFVPYGRVGATTNFLLSSSLSPQKHARFTQVQAA